MQEERPILRRTRAGETAKEPDHGGPPAPAGSAEAKPAANDSSPGSPSPTPRLTRRQLLAGSAAAGLAATLGALPGAALAASTPSRRPEITPGFAPGDEAPELVLRNGKIHTFDDRNRVVSSVAIKNGRFSAVGDRVPAPGPGTKVINLHGRTVVPGIIDNHNHIVLMGNRPGFHTPLENAMSIADVQRIYAERAAQIPDGAWITTIGGFHFNQFAERRLPTRSELDEAVPDHPVYASISFLGPSTTNSLGKAFFEAHGVTVADDGAIAAGTAGATGSATLALRQTLLDDASRQRGVIDALAYGLSLGVTTHLDQGAFQKTDTPSDGAAHEDNFRMHLPFLAVHAAGKLKARVQINFLHMEADPATPELVERLKNAFPFFGDDMLATGAIGEFIAAYPPSPSPEGPFFQAARRIAQARWRAEVHSLTRTDFQVEVAGFEAAHAAFGIDDLRWVIAHVPFITEDYVDRLKAIGGGLSLTGWRYLAGTAINNGPPFRMIVENGIHAGMSSDGMQIAPMNPWLHMYYATTGVNARGDLINDGQQISRQDVLRLYTRDNGWFLRAEDRLGSIEVGKLADLVVLDRDYFTVPDEDLKRIRSLLTVVGGKVVHDMGVI